MAKSRSIRLDEKTEEMLLELDRQLNLESNVSAVFRLAIQTLYAEQKEVSNYVNQRISEKRKD